MTELFPAPLLTLDVISKKDAGAHLLISLAPAAEKPAPGLPGPEAGDTFLSQKDGQAVLMVSLGKAAKISLETLRRTGGAIARWLAKNKVAEANLALADLNEIKLEGAPSALFEGLLLGAYQFTHYKSAEDARPTVSAVHIIAGTPGKIKPLVERAATLCKMVNMAREWGHEPANVINPVTLAERAQAVAAEYHLKCTVLDDKQLEAMGAGAIVAVGQGSKTPSRLIILEYPGTDSSLKPVVLVGKALTFDSGGYSLKGVENIVTMKYDKCGGMAVIGTLLAAAALKIKTPLVGVIGASENMVSDQAYRPDDIITTLSGKTVEIITTDAEGRLVLADALTYAQRNFQPRALIDLATLTGGVVTALGRVRGGLMSNNPELVQQLMASGEATFERLWQLPLDDDYLKSTKGEEADLKNSGGREGHPIMGGIFLKQFVSDEIPWAHLDIAGTADSNKEMPYCPKGATGFGIRLLIHYIESLG
ncbi:MAG TPA: leucyl aminopeptidase [Anaerolineaceae bacterium]|nr:leucyl aminopeptidase [Anaerolineaceae bacterium]HPN52680.1 leucyl aminopeptidase [Anaerolineaceae bacterium]